MGHRIHTRNKGIAKRRRLVGMTQHALAQAASIPVQKITFFETGRCELSPEKIERIWEALKTKARVAMDAVGA